MHANHHTHGWLNGRAVVFVDTKRAAQRTPLEMDTTLARSAGLAVEYHDNVVRTAQKMRDLEASSKLWWKKAKEVMKYEAQVSSSIPALKTNDGVWVLNAQGKANLFADTFAGKCKLPRPSQNVYTECHQSPDIQGSFIFPTEKQCLDTLENLSDESSTGPGLAAARILESCAEQLAKPLQILLSRLLETASWPESWRECWIVPTNKKKVVFSASNNRGVRLTAQLSTVAERLLLPMLEAHISHTVAFGPNQFTYVKGRGARGAVACLTMSWILALNRRQKAALHCSDVSGAFDRVRAERLLEKLRSKGVHPALVDLAGSWLQQRSAQVVEGQRSDKMLLRNMVFQGTVLGPTLWNLSHEDARRALHEAGFVEIAHADDLNGFREFEHNSSVDSVMTEAKRCQAELHRWCKANQVSRDPAQQSFHIVSHTRPHGDSFTLLGVTFDCKLRMDLCVGRR